MAADRSVEIMACLETSVGTGLKNGFVQASLFDDISPSASEAQHQVSTDLPDALIFRICVKYSNKKYFVFSEVRISCMTCPVPPPHEGRIAIVTDVGSGMRWTWRRARRALPARTAKSCGPGPPTLGSSLAKTFREVTVAKKPGTPGRSRISR
jgi:hypothetical protein